MLGKRATATHFIALSFLTGENSLSQRKWPDAATIVASAAAFKAVGGASAVVAGGASLAPIVVMLMTPPRSPREWSVGLISSVVSSIGGAAAIEHFGLHQWVTSPIGLCAMGRLIFACGLPGWAIVRWVLNFIDRNRDASIDEIVRKVKNILRSGVMRTSCFPVNQRRRDHAASVGVVEIHACLSWSCPTYRDPRR